MKQKMMLCVIVMCFTAVFAFGGIDDGRVYHWKFEGNLLEQINGNNGTLTGTGNYVKGADGDALNLLPDSYVQILDDNMPSGTAVRTISLVAQLKGDSSTEVLFSYGDDSANGRAFIIQQTNSGLGIDFRGHFWGTPSIYSDWTLITVVIPTGATNTNDAILYINGALVAAEKLLGNTKNLDTAINGNAYIGRDLSGTGFLKSVIDDVRVYDRALSETEIRELYNLYESSLIKRGANGWSPVLQAEDDGGKLYLKVVDWTGGEDPKPAIPAPNYLGDGQYVTKAEALDFRGPQGLTGATGPVGPAGLAPEHEWSDTLLRFKNPDGTWGAYSDLQGPVGPEGPPGPSGDGTGFIAADLTLEVPTAEYATIQDALEYLDDKVISKNALVTIHVADGNYTDYDTILVSHANGDRIAIIGNTSNPSLCSITFKYQKHGVNVSIGHALGKLDGFTFSGMEQNVAIGIVATHNGTIICGTNMRLLNFRRGFYARMSSTIFARNAIVTDCYDGFACSETSFIDARSARVERTTRGVVSQGTSSIYFQYGTAINNGTGLYAQMMSFIDSTGATVSGNSSNKVVAQNSYIY